MIPLLVVLFPEYRGLITGSRRQRVGAMEAASPPAHEHRKQAIEQTGYRVSVDTENR